jgi:hypothetical protein
MSSFNKIVRENLIIVAFGALAVYTFTQEKVLEGIVYLLVTLGFGLMALIKTDKFARYRKTLNILSWVVILGAVLLFIALLRQDAYSF